LQLYPTGQLHSPVENRAGRPADSEKVRGHVVDTAALALHGPAQRVIFGVPRGVPDRLLARVLGPPDVTTAAGGLPQRRQVELEDHFLLHSRTIAADTVITPPDQAAW
jgi:hypothetical protein